MIDVPYNFHNHKENFGERLACPQIGTNKDILFIKLIMEKIVYGSTIVMKNSVVNPISQMAYNKD